MRARLVVLGLVLLVVAVQLSRESGRALAPLSGEPENVAPTTAPAQTPAPPSSAFARDPFRFPSEPPVARDRRFASEAVAAKPRPSPEPPAARVRLVGLVRRAGVLRAALALDGEVVLATAGETVFGFLVLSLDEEKGARVRDPEGLETTLVLPEEP